MRMVDIIQKKRDKGILSTDEIEWMIAEYTANNIPDYQMSALLMAIYLHGMTRAETVALTLAMAHSGHLMDLSAITDYAVDKHSSGGVGDKTTLIVLPLVAACGVAVAKMSGRGLGFSGGTLDKLEAIAGFNVRLSEEEFGNLARQYGIVLCGQTGELAPADGKLYALRDVTATVPSLPLIASSIMSKKLASGANGIVLDVKWGNGAFMNTLESARELAQVMVDIGTDAGRDMIAVLSDMNQPLGYAIGNALEVVEAIETLNGGGAHDLREHCLHIAKYMLQLAGRGQQWTNEEDTLALLTQKLDNGEAFAKFRLMVEAQGGDVRMIDNPDLLPKATHQIVVNASQSGIIASVNAEKIARAGLALGAGRMKKEDNIDLAVGVVTRIKVGDSVQSGTPLATIHANDLSQAEEAKALVLSAVEYSPTPVEPLPLFYGVIHGKK
jgi:pyrimidine-nucleoside phosphorylase